VIEITRISSTPRPFWRVKSDQREVSHRPASKQKRGFLHKCDGHAAEKARAAQHFPVFEKISKGHSFAIDARATVIDTLRPTVYAKIFRQIFDSSIARDFNVRRLFMELLVLADRDGIVDMTIDAIARTTNVPLELIEAHMLKLEEADPDSRNKEADGRRIIRLDPGRSWGWQIVNYDEYRKIRDQESLRAYNRERKRAQRVRDKEKDKEERSLHPKEEKERERDTDTEVTLGHKVSQHVTVVNDNGSSLLFPEAAAPSPSAGMEKRKVSLRRAKDWDELKAFFAREGFLESDAAWYWEKMEGCGWTNDGKAVANWKMTASSWERTNRIFPSHKPVEEKGKF